MSVADRVGPPGHAEGDIAMGQDTDNESDYGGAIEYDDQLESLLQAAESLADIPIGLERYADLPPDEQESGKHGQRPAESAREEQDQQNGRGQVGEVMDIEDAVPLGASSPFEQFRKKGWLSVSDLVGTVWCEVQYDYELGSIPATYCVTSLDPGLTEEHGVDVDQLSRLRTLPFLPPSKRPDKIVTDKGKEIGVDKVKVEGKERILKRGEKIHKRLEREIHPAEIIVTTTTREDVWGLRFLNMLSALEALLTLGQCREMPVVGFMGGVLIMGIIDEITRKPIDTSSAASVPTRSSRQTALTSFFSSSPSKPTKVERTHKLYVSDSKTRASGTLPKEADTLAGRLQCMVYKELLDAMLLSSYPSRAQAPPAVQPQDTPLRPTATPFSFSQVFSLLDLDPAASFSDSFVAQSRPVVMGNALRFGAAEAMTLETMVAVWDRYVEQLCLGSGSASPAEPPKAKNSPRKQKDKNKAKYDDVGRSDVRLELVYRRAGPTKDKQRAKKASGSRKRRRGRRKGGDGAEVADEAVPPIKQAEGSEDATGELDGNDEDETAIQLAIEASLRPPDASADSGPVDTALSATSAQEQHSAVAPSAITTPISDASTAVQNAGSSASRMLTEIYRFDRTSDEEREEEELAWAVEMSLVEDLVDDEAGAVKVSLSQSAAKGHATSDIASKPEVSSSAPSGSPDVEMNETQSSGSPTPEPSTSGTSGSIIGRHRFQHDPDLLERHLRAVMQYWRGEREPEGVSLAEVSRCAWCEFEEGCEWRAKKAEEAWSRVREKRNGRLEESAG